MKKIDVERAKEIMLEILVDFDEFCKQKKLNYWIDYGTLLGARRHGGFIPWDDDIDVSMPRDDYNKFIELSKEFKPEKYIVQKQSNYRTKRKVYHIKIRKRNTFYKYKYDTEEAIDDRRGIYIDIFPANQIDKKDCILYNTTIYIAKLFRNRYISIEKLTKLFINLANSLHDPRKEYMVIGAEALYPLPCIHKNIIIPLSKIRFEGYEFNSPAKIDTYLKIVYGADFLSLPPVEKRISHALEAYENINESENLHEEIQTVQRKTKE